MTAPASATPSDRALTAFRRLVLSVFPGFVYTLVHEYAVAESDGLTFSGTPTDASFSPPLPTQVPYAPCLAGTSCVVPVGTLAYVGFANGDPAKPYLVRFGPGTTTALALASGGPAVARVAEAVRLCYDGGGSFLYSAPESAPPYTWTPIPVGSLPGLAPPTPTDPGVAIVTGSTKVTCG